METKHDDSYKQLYILIQRLQILYQVCQGWGRERRRKKEKRGWGEPTHTHIKHAFNVILINTSIPLAINNVSQNQTICKWLKSSSIITEKMEFCKEGENTVCVCVRVFVCTCVCVCVCVCAHVCMSVHMQTYVHIFTNSLLGWGRRY